ncbi:beta strand repeat-containing protein, partial [uncultured Sphingomonas sp.]|uniref:beta strand repeat-containing protein n=1 Tax=uncultured Sphingomonas sp. TaxID=158754 RepID=UPI0035C9BD3F
MVRYALLAGCATGIGLAAGLAEGPARAQAFQGTPIAVATGTVTFDRTTPGVETITALRPTAIIDWTPSDTTGTGTVNFLPQGNVATFTSTPTIGAGYTILNRIMPSDTTRSVTLDGIIHGYQGGTTVNGGTLWFYSPGGLIIGADARLDVGSLLLTANPIAIGTNNELYGSSGQIQLRAGNAGAQVLIANGATITAPQPGSYIAVVSPRITQGGTVNVNGSAAYVAADSVDLTFNAGLFTIAIQTGATASSDILQHTGTTTGPASTGAGDPHRIYLVAVSRNDAITMLASGTLGFAAATSASIQNGAIILSAGRDISGGDPPAAPGSIGAPAAVNLTNATVTSPVSLFASSTAQVTASGIVPVARIDAPQSITINTPGFTGGGTLTSTGPISIAGGSFALGAVTSGGSITATVTGDLSAGAVTATNSVGITATGLVTLTNATVGDDLTISAGSANLTTLRATYTGGADVGNDGSNIRVTTAGDLTVHDAAAVYGIALTAGTGGTGTLTADLLHTDRAATTLLNQGSGDIRLTTLDSQGDVTLTATGGAITG